MKLYYRIFSCIIVCLLLAGCAEIQLPWENKQILKDPLGDGSLKIGMTKEKVVSIYGQPDLKDTVVSSEWNESREEWIYTATTSVLPVGLGHLSEDIYLYFDGENLTNIERKPLGRPRDEIK